MQYTLKHFILLFVLGLFSNSLLFGQSETKSLSESLSSPTNELKVSALKILKIHCNDCHSIQRTSTIFTLDNMDKKAKKINRQVFISKRMPKGKVNRDKMTQEEMNTLKEWIALYLN